MFTDSRGDHARAADPDSPARLAVNVMSPRYSRTAPFSATTSAAPAVLPLLNPVRSLEAL